MQLTKGLCDLAEIKSVLCILAKKTSFFALKRKKNTQKKKKKRRKHSNVILAKKDCFKASFLPEIFCVRACGSENN